MRVLNVYKWATVGGVEKVILNRACAFKKNNMKIKQDVFFFHDSGGLQNFQKFIDVNKLDDYISVVSEIDEKTCDVIHTFDTPEVFDKIKTTSKVVVECHSPYKESRRYLRTLPQDIKYVLSPGETFKQTVVQSEIPDALKNKVFVLPNFHITDEPAEGYKDTDKAKIWGKKPIFYIGRMDSMKNTKELLEIFWAVTKKLGDEYFLMLVGDVRPHYMDIKKAIKKLRLESGVAYYRPIPYENVDVLLKRLHLHKGIFVSPSKGESFGLSALEAMSNAVPVLLSDIGCHTPLIDDDSAFNYQLGRTNDAVEKIKAISENYDEYSAKMKRFAENHNCESFIAAWKKLYCPNHDNGRGIWIQGERL